MPVRDAYPALYVGSTVGYTARLFGGRAVLPGRRTRGVVTGPGRSAPAEAGRGWSSTTRPGAYAMGRGVMADPEWDIQALTRSADRPGY